MVSEYVELFKFLGGDIEARKITRALSYWEGIRTPDELRKRRAETWTLARDNGRGGWDTEEVPYMLSMRHIGPKRLARIDAALAGEL